MNELADRFQSEYTRLITYLGQIEQHATPSLARLKLLQEAYEWTSKVSTWPIETRLFYRLAATILAPFAFTLQQVLLDRLIK